MLQSPGRRLLLLTCPPSWRQSPRSATRLSSSFFLIYRFHGQVLVDVAERAHRVRDRDGLLRLAVVEDEPALLLTLCVDPLLRQDDVQLVSLCSILAFASGSY